MSRQLNHSRHLDYYAQDIGDAVYWQARTTPTFKQTKFFNRLGALCRMNGLDQTTHEYIYTRTGMAMAIDTLIQRLKSAGIDIEGNGKRANYVLELGEDRRGRETITERIIMREIEQHDLQP